MLKLTVNFIICSIGSSRLLCVYLCVALLWRVCGFKDLTFMRFLYKSLTGVIKMASAAKKPKLSTATTSLSNGISSKSNDIEEFMKKLQAKREETAVSILEYKFNKKRVRIVSQEQMVPDNCEGVVYWMSRDSRVQDNWAFLFAQKLALKNEVPLHVCFCLIAKYLDASVRQFDFLIKGIQTLCKQFQCNLPSNS